MTAVDDLPLFLNAARAARFLGVGKVQFRRMVEAGEVPMFRDPNTGTKRYPTRALVRWTEQMQAPKEAS